MSKTGWIEKRQHERVVATLKIEYRLVGNDISKQILDHADYKQTTVDQLSKVSPNSTVYQAATRDISVGGLSLVSEDPLNMGDIAEIGLHLPKYQSVLKFLAKVVRVTSDPEMGRMVYHAGVQTIAINQEDLKRIEKFLRGQKS